jgi:NitT/TauT family transport system permease protein
VFVCFVSATPMLVVNVFQGSLAVPRELRDMSDSYDVKFWAQMRHLVIPSMAGYVMAGLRVAILAGWGAVMLVEWFGNMMGAGYRARYWYDAGNFDGLMGWGVIILVFVITIDRAILERVVRRAHQWRTGLTGLGSAQQKAGSK